MEFRWIQNQLKIKISIDLEQLIYHGSLLGLQALFYGSYSSHHSHHEMSSLAITHRHCLSLPSHHHLCWSSFPLPTSSPSMIYHDSSLAIFLLTMPRCMLPPRFDVSLPLYRWSSPLSHLHQVDCHLSILSPSLPTSAIVEVTATVSSSTTTIAHLHILHHEQAPATSSPS